MAESMIEPSDRAIAFINAIEQGGQAKREGAPVTANPYSESQQYALWMAWKQGWREATVVQEV